MTTSSNYNNYYNNNEMFLSLKEMNTLNDINNTLTITNITKTYDNNNSNNISIESENNNSLYKNNSKYDDIDVNEGNSLSEYKFKIILLGDCGVGKTAIFQRFINNNFIPDYKCTIGCEYKTRSIKLSINAIVELCLWDTAGTEKFQSVTRSYYRDANGIVLIFDLTDKKSFNRLKRWVIEIKEYCLKDAEIILVGNKSDCNNRIIDKEEAKLFAKNYNYKYIETSALNGTNVLLLFETISNKLVEKERINENKDKGKKNKFINYNRANSLNADKYIQKRIRMNDNLPKKDKKSLCC